MKLFQRDEAFLVKVLVTSVVSNFVVIVFDLVVNVYFIVAFIHVDEVDITEFSLSLHSTQILKPSI